MSKTISLNGGWEDWKFQRKIFHPNSICWNYSHKHTHVHTNKISFKILTNLIKKRFEKTSIESLFSYICISYVIFLFRNFASQTTYVLNYRYRLPITKIFFMRISKLIPIRFLYFYDNFENFINREQALSHRLSMISGR